MIVKIMPVMIITVGIIPIKTYFTVPSIPLLVCGSPACTMIMKHYCAKPSAQLPKHMHVMPCVTAAT